MDTQAFFPANGQLPGDRDGGHDGDRGPLWSAPSSPLASPFWWARAMPPLWQYFLESWTPKHFSLQIGSFLGTATGAMMAIADPSGRHPLRG
jgi:hypothetical protein